MKRLLKISFAALTLSAASITALAGGTSTGAVTTPFAKSTSPIVTIYSSNNIATNPSCNTSNRFAIDSSTAGGRALLTIALMAKAVGSTVYFQGSGYCTLDSVSEDLLASRHA